MTIINNKIYSLLERKAHVAIVLWVLYFCYAICAALIFQKILLPLIPSMHAGGGLVINDSVYFDSVATAMAERIRDNGWSSWQLFPANGAPANVAVLATLYALFGHDPTLIIPVNAALHALAGVLIFLLAFEFSERFSIGLYAGVVAGTLFAIFPSALLWYGQMHKDGYAIAGTLLILLSWLKVLKPLSSRGTWAWLISLNAAGMVLIGIVRPYALKFFLIAAVLLLLVFLISSFTSKDGIRGRKLSGFFLIVLFTAGFGLHLLQQANSSKALQMGDTYSHVNLAWTWQNSPWFPDQGEKYVELAARTRAGMIEHGLAQNAGSMIDTDIKPHNILETVAYLPRTFQIATLAPFPSTWFEKMSITRLGAVGEMAIYYVCLIGVILLIYCNRSPSVRMALFFSLFFLIIYGFTLANIGTLYRSRYAFTWVLMLLGIVGWFTWLERRGRFDRLIRWSKSQVIAAHASANNSHIIEKSANRREAVSSGFLVLGLTFVGFVGFFLRDVLMARQFGLGTSLDNFYIAMLVPMFVVTVLCMPMGTAFIPSYLEMKEKSNSAAQALVSHVSFWIALVLVATCLLLYIATPQILPHIHSNLPGIHANQLLHLSAMALTILLFSGFVVLGNSVLNANQRAVLTTSAQLIVPVTAIIGLLVFGEKFGVTAVMLGMVIGQLFNLMIVQYFLRHQNVSLMPRRPFKQNFSEILILVKQYFPLAVSAFFISIAAVVSTLLAMKLPDGAVAAFNLGNKVVLFVTGLVGAAVSTVMLPYFSSLIAKNHIVSARRELSFFLLLSTFISVPISAAMYVWAGDIVSILFEGGPFNDKASKEVERVMQYALIQLPFFVSNAILLKFATATKHVMAISIAALFGLVINIATTLLLMKVMGVGGIALGVSISVVMSTLLLVVILVRYGHITFLDFVVMLLNWVLFATLLVSVHFHTTPSMTVILIAYIALLVGYASSLPYDRLLHSKTVY